MKIASFWDKAPCSLEVDRRFRGAYCLHQGDEFVARLIALMTEEVRTSETSAHFNVLHGAISQNFILAAVRT
jgi:hypothetical protein